MPLLDLPLRVSVVADLATSQKFTEMYPDRYQWGETKQPNTATVGEMLLNYCHDEPQLIRTIVLNIGYALVENKEGSREHNNAIAACKFLENGYKTNKYIKSILDKGLGPTWTRQVSEYPFDITIQTVATFIYMKEYPIATSSTPSIKQEPEGSQFRFMSK